MPKTRLAQASGVNSRAEQADSHSGLARTLIWKQSNVRSGGRSEEPFDTPVQFAAFAIQPAGIALMALHAGGHELENNATFPSELLQESRATLFALAGQVGATGDWLPIGSGVTSCDGGLEQPEIADKVSRAHGGDVPERRDGPRA